MQKHRQDNPGDFISRIFYCASRVPSPDSRKWMDSPALEALFFRKTKVGVSVTKDEVSTKDLSELLEMLSNYYEGSEVLEIHIFFHKEDK